MSGTQELPVLPGVYAGRQFGDLTVIRTGVRAGHCASNPRGYPAAECHCGCGATTAVPLYRLLNGNTKSCGHGACYRPRTTGVRAGIVAYVGETGGAWMAQIRDRFGLTGSACGGHLRNLVKTGRLERPARGFYCLPGQVPDPIPGPPAGVFSARSSKAGVARWENMDRAARDKRIQMLADGRVRAAGRRQAQPG